MIQSEKKKCCDHEEIKPLSKQEFLDHYSTFEYLAPRIPNNIINFEDKLDYLVKVTNHLRSHESPVNLKALGLYKKEVSENYTYLHPSLLNFETWGICQEFINAMEQQDFQFVHKEADGIFSIPLFSEEFCEVILEEIENIEVWCSKVGRDIHRPNSMNNYGIILDDIGMGTVIQNFIDRYINKALKLLFNIDTSLDHHHAFVVSYQIGKDEKLDFHVDDSDLTLNICLGRSFEGGSLFFGGVRCNHHLGTPVEKDENVTINHKVGRALIHLGHHRHSAQHITSGERHNLIIWCKSSKIRTLRSIFECRDWCRIYEYLETDSDSENGMDMNNN